MLYTLPVSLFGMSVSAAELPAMSSALRRRSAKSAGYLRQRLNAGLRQIAFFIVPSAMAFLALGDVIAAALFQTGTIHARRFAITSGASWRARRWDCWLDARPAVLVDLLRAARHAHAAAVRRDPRGAHTGLGYVCAMPCRAGSASTAMGRGGADGSAGVAGWVEFMFCAAP